MGLTVISVSRIAKAGYSVSFEGEEYKIKNKKGDTIGNIPVNEREHAYSAITVPEKVDILTLHGHLGHISADLIRTTQSKDCS